MQWFKQLFGRFFNRNPYLGRRFYSNPWESSEAVPDELFAEMMVNPRVVLGVALADANDIRLALAIGEGKLKALPVARLGKSEQCVLARALSNGWGASVNESATTLFHPAKGITREQVVLAGKTLDDLGFQGVNVYLDAENGYYLGIPHTWAMEELVKWYDRGAFPDLVLSDDKEGQEVVADFQAKRQKGFTLQDIREDREYPTGTPVPEEQPSPF